MSRSLGIDLGSTSIKACLWELQEGELPRLLARASRELPLLLPQPGYAVQDPLASLQAVRELLAEMPPYDRLGYASAMHGLLGLDRHGEPVGPVVSWADQRAWPEAERLQNDPRAREWAERTGTPLHPMAWPAKLLHLGASTARRWVGLKEFIAARLQGLAQPPWMDRSLASATGLYASNDWDAELLELVGLRREQLPEVVEPDQDLGGFVLGAGDGPLSHVGTGASCCISIGTSGALRVICPAGTATGGGQLFRYYLSRERWVCGGAISNGSLVLDWLRDLQNTDPETLLQQVAGVPAGCEGLVALPYLMGERSPIWDARARGALVGLSIQHGQAHIARAMLEGVVFCLRQVRDTLAERPTEIRVTGGMSRSPIWLQMLADGLGQSIVAMAEPEAGALGAALLACPVAVRLEELAHYHPGPNQEVLDAVYARYRQLYPALRPVMHA